MPVLERIEERTEKRVLDRRAVAVRLEIALGDVGLVQCASDQHSVPGRILGRPAPRYLVVPLVAQRELEVDVDDDPAVVEEPVMDELTDRELGRVGHALILPPEKPRDH